MKCTTCLGDVPENHAIFLDPVGEPHDLTVNHHRFCDECLREIRFELGLMQQRNGVHERLNALRAKASS